MAQQLELKRDIGPRELEIQKLNEQTNKMRQELKHFNRVNQNLALIVDDLRMRQEGLTNEVQKLRDQLDEQESYKKKFKDDVQAIVEGASFKSIMVSDAAAMKSATPVQLQQQLAYERLQAADSAVHKSAYECYELIVLALTLQIILFAQLNIYYSLSFG